MVIGAPSGLWRAQAFRRYAAADAVSKLGSQVTLVALPLTAALTLRATPFEVGVLAAAETLAFLLVGLPAGAWVDRMRRRPVLVAADLVRAGALMSIPAAAWAGVLTLPHLYGVALITGVCTVFFDVAQQSFLPSIVATEDLARGNGVTAASLSIAQLTGPGLGGWLVQLLTAPAAMLADGISYLWSAALLAGIRTAEGKPRAESRHLRREIAEGIRFVAGHPVLRLIAILGGLAMFSAGIWTASLPLFLVRVVGLGPGAYGLLLSLGAVGGVVGAALAARIGARFGMGPTIAGSAAMVAVSYVPIALTGPGWRLAIFPIALAVVGSASTVLNVTQLAYRQTICPPRLLGRLNATMRFLMWGAAPLGGLVGGALGELAGVRAAFVTACGGFVVAHLPVLFNRALRRAR
jgi:MFS family permease